MWKTKVVCPHRCHQLPLCHLAACLGDLRPWGRQPSNAGAGRAAFHLKISSQIPWRGGSETIVVPLRVLSLQHTLKNKALVYLRHISQQRIFFVEMGIAQIDVSSFCLQTTVPDPKKTQNCEQDVM